MEVGNLNIENNLLGDIYFKIIYPNQNYKISLEYKKWKKSIEEKFGKNGKELFCKKDNIIIYQKNENINSFVKCPICDQNIYQCQYCNRIKDKDTARCCLKRHIKEINDKDKIKQFIEYKRKEDINDFLNIFFWAFIPFIFATQFILIFVYLFFFNLEDKNGLMIIDRTFQKERQTKMIPFKIILFFYLICINLPYAVLFYAVYLIIVILSLPFKLYPIKIIFGIFYSII